MASRIFKNNKRDLWTVNFYDPIQKKELTISSFKSIEDAEQRAHEKDIEFYTDKTYLLERGISMNRQKKRFVVYTRHFQIAKFKTLRRAREVREEILMDLIIARHSNRTKIEE